MANNSEKITPELVDEALLDVKKAVESGRITLEKAVVDKRAMGGATEKEEDYSSGGGRLYKDGKNPGAHPADGGYKDNFASKYPMDDKGKSEGSALSGAVKESAITKAKIKPRGLTKAVDKSSASSSSTSSKSSKSSKSSMKKAVSSKSSKSSKSSVKKAIGEAVVSDNSGVSSVSGSEAPKKTGNVEKAVSSYSSMSKAISSKSSASSKSSKSSIKKAVDGSSSASASQVSGASSGASRLNVKKSLGKYMKKAVEKLISSQKHLTKAFNDGSAEDMDIAGQRLVEVQKNITKAVKHSEPVSDNILHNVKKSAKYFSKAIEAYEQDNLKLHEKAVGKTEKYLGKAISDCTSLEKSLNKTSKKSEKPLAKSVDTTITFTKDETGKFVMPAMDEDTFRKVEKALNKEGLYKSVGDELADERKVIEASPLLKGIVDKLSKSFDSMRDATLAEKEENKDYQKKLYKSIKHLAEVVKNTVTDVERIKDTPKMRKSVLTPVESPLGGSKEIGGRTIEKSVGFNGSMGDFLVDGQSVGDILLKGVEKGIITPDVVMRWDDAKVDLSEIPAETMGLIKRIQGN